MSALVISLLFGSGVALVVWMFFQVFHNVPVEDRQYLDRPPIGFRLIWPLIQFLVFYTGHLYGTSFIKKTMDSLRIGGVEYSISPHQFIAAKLLSGIIFGLVVGIFLMFYVSGFSWLSLLAATIGFWYPDLWLKELTKNRAKAIVKVLPFYLDIITLSVESGNNLTGGLTHAVKKTSDSELRKEISRVLRDIRSGKSRADSLRDLSERSGSSSVASVVSSLVQAEKSGASLGPILRAQAHQLRNRRFQQAEKKAMEAPVKMLGPLVVFIFPTTSIAIGFVLLSKAIQEGLITWAPILWAYSWPA